MVGVGGSSPLAPTIRLLHTVSLHPISPSSCWALSYPRFPGVLPRCATSRILCWHLGQHHTTCRRKPDSRQHANAHKTKTTPTRKHERRQRKCVQIECDEKKRVDGRSTALAPSLLNISTSPFDSRDAPSDHIAVQESCTECTAGSLLCKNQGCGSWGRNNFD